MRYFEAAWNCYLKNAKKHKYKRTFVKSYDK